MYGSDYEVYKEAEMMKHTFQEVAGNFILLKFSCALRSVGSQIVNGRT